MASNSVPTVSKLRARLANRKKIAAQPKATVASTITKAVKVTEANILKVSSDLKKINAAFSNPKSVFTAATLNKVLSFLQTANTKVAKLQSITSKNLRVAHQMDMPSVRMANNFASLGLLRSQIASLAIQAEESLPDDQIDTNMAIDDSGYVVDPSQLSGDDESNMMQTDGEGAEDVDPNDLDNPNLVVDVSSDLTLQNPTQKGDESDPVLQDPESVEEGMGYNPSQDAEYLQGKGGKTQSRKAATPEEDTNAISADVSDDMDGGMYGDADMAALDSVLADIMPEVEPDADDVPPVQASTTARSRKAAAATRQRSGASAGDALMAMVLQDMGLSN